MGAETSTRPQENAHPRVESSYFEGGTINTPDPHTIAAIKDLRNQRDRAEGAVFYALELSGLYADPRRLEQSLVQVKSDYDKLPTEGEVTNVEDTMQEASTLRTRKLGLELLLQTSHGVRDAVQEVIAKYHTTYFEIDEASKKPVIIFNSVIDLYDRTDEEAEHSPLIQILHAMTGLDKDSMTEAERLIRLLFIKDEPLISDE